MKQLIKISSILFLLVILGVAPAARAEFVKSTSLNWISSSQEIGTAGVTVLPAAGLSTNPVGLVVYASKEVIPAQLFHPSKLQTDKSVSCFLRYDPTKRAYTELVLPYGKTFAISGNITLQLQDTLRVSISTENGSMPYVSIIHKSDPRSVLAVLGTDVVVSGKGARFESYLEAGARNSSESFDVENSGLYLQGIQFSDQKIGLPNQSSQTNVCLTKGVLFANKFSFDELSKGNIPGEIRKQSDAFKHGDDPQVLTKYTVLNVLPDAVIALDGYGKPVVIQEQKLRVGDMIVCSIFDLALS